ncbi:hypothetical protein LWI29_018362 [Acer saccharum]|uniref:Glycoside hydrolase family 3 C-terminal domain-containing protein n=1 Tax=Acer saccharum TaxID=4024 RepID=A0AA39T4R1_ACESA|nr:hypothetical protein LWI29_018362 [Acer saccharum]
MVAMNYTKFINGLTSQVKKNIIPMSIIDDAVKRILRVKFAMGLFEDPLVNKSLVDQLGSQEHRELAREAVKNSLVLLKNGELTDEPLLPLPKKSSKKLVAGSHADNLGTTILTAIKNIIDPQTEVLYEENLNSNYVKSNNFSYSIVVVGEHQYAETFGDSLNLTIPEPGPSIICVEL